MFKQFMTAAIVSAGLALPAGAATITESYSTFVTSDALSTQGTLFSALTAFSKDFDGVSGSAADVSMSKYGFGSRGTSTLGNVEGNRIGGGEALVFSFSSTVSLNSLTLGTQVAGDQRYSIYVDGLLSSANGLTISGADSFDTGADQAIGAAVNLGGYGLSGSSFAIVGLDSGAGNQGVRVLGLTVTGETPNVQGAFPTQFSLTNAATVPLPATAPLLAGALGFGAFVMRRRKR